MRARSRILVFLLVVAGLALSCSSGGGGDNGSYNFTGKWAYAGVVTASNVGTTTVGDRITDVLIVNQNGTAVTATFQSTGSMLPMSGTCDPVAKTINFSGTHTATGIAMQHSGTAEDGDTLSGTWSFTLSWASVSGTWTANLSTRTISGLAPVTATGRTVASLLAELQGN